MSAEESDDAHPGTSDSPHDVGHAGSAHHHEGHDHDHDDDVVDEDADLRDNPIWQQDNVMLRSVGIDIGSAGTQVNFTQLHLRRMGEDLTSRYFVIRRERLYQSPVQLTPYADDQRIDGEKLGGIIDQAYDEAGQRPEAIDTGVVILTGEALRRTNAARIASVVADMGGDFVCASAGHHMESVLAAFGSGAARLSHDRGCRILNVDIGGGTTKLAIVECGRVLATAALHVGGRLVAVGEEDRIVRLEPGGAAHARRAGYDWCLGDVADHDARRRVAESMAELLVTALRAPDDPKVGDLWLTDPLTDLADVDGLLFSGGVGEYVYAREARDFRDLGRALGVAVREQVAAGAFPAPLLEAHECMRATVLGASEHSVQLSGNTTYLSDAEALLPRRNLQVLRPALDLRETIDPAEVASAVRDHVNAIEVDATRDDDVALALSWQGPPAYERVLALARGVVWGLQSRVDRGRPVYLVLDGDLARTLGAVMREDLDVRNELLVLDGLRLDDFDFIDLGRVRMPSNTVPVTIKSLVFEEADAQATAASSAALEPSADQVLRAERGER